MDINNFQSFFPYFDLGEINGQRKFYSNSIISQRMIDKIDRVTMSMVEHGFVHFYQSYLIYKEQRAYAKEFFMFDIILNKTKNDSNEFQSISVEQFKTPMIILLFLNGIATIIFVAEILVSKWLKWRSCTYYQHNFSHIQ